VTSGIRIGTPAVTTRGFTEADCVTLADWICDVVDDLENEAVIERVRDDVSQICKRYPVYPDA
jgi:glycine hydroxymethyltransferase